MHTGDPDHVDSTATFGGKIPGSEGQAAYVLHRHNELSIPILIAVPHAGRNYPPALLKRMRFPQEAALRLEDRYVDLIARRVANATGATLLLASAPRAMIDLNRSPDDVDWDMVAGPGKPPARTRLAAGRRSRSGLGLVPRRLPGMGELWRRKLHSIELSERIEQVHVPYHMALSTTLENLRDQWGAALLIDMHSMPPLGPKSGTQAAADFVVGDRFGASCESYLVAAALDHLGMRGLRTAHNRPYAGGYVLDRHAAPARAISAMQLEICRASYLDTPLREPAVGLPHIAEEITLLVKRLAGEVARGAQGFVQAAE